MTYRFLGHTMKLAVYQCPGCDKFFKAQVGHTHLTCATAHLPGNCCHFGEREVSAEQVLFAIDALKEDDE